MDKESQPWFRGGVTLTVLVGLAGALIATPAISLTSQDKKQVKKIAKKQATKVFNSKFQGAFDAAIAPIEDANQDKCVEGAVLAFATIDGDEVTGPGFSSTGVLRQFNCAGGGITVEDNGTGNYDVRIPGVTSPAPTDAGRIAASVTVADVDGNFGSYQSNATQDFINVETFDAGGGNFDDEFSIVIFNKP
jgi:hypothetical protein